MRYAPVKEIAANSLTLAGPCSMENTALDIDRRVNWRQSKPLLLQQSQSWVAVA